MGNTAKIKATGDMRDLLGAFDKVSAKVMKLEKELSDVKKGGAKAGEATDKGWSKAGKTMLGVAAAIGVATTAQGLLTKAVQLGVAEYENLKRMRIEAGQAGQQIGISRAKALANVPAAQHGLFDSLVEGAAQRKVLPLVRDPGNALGAAVFSAGQGLRDDQIAAAFNEASFESSLSGEAEVGFGGTLTGIIKQTPALKKMKDADEAARLAAGSFFQFAQASRPEERSFQARLLRRTTALASSTGIPAEQLKELASAISQEAQDTEGQISFTALVRLTRNVETARTTGFDLGGGKKLRITGRDGAGLEELLEKGKLLTPDQQDVFFQGFPLGRAAGRPASQSIVTGKESGLAAMATAERLITPVAEAGGERDARIKSALSGKFGEAAEVDRAFVALTENLRVSSPDTIRAGIITKRLPEALRAAGASDLAQRFAVGKLTLSEAKEALPLAISQLESERMEILGRFAKPNFGGEQEFFSPHRTPTSEDRTQAALMQTALDALIEAQQRIERSENETVHAGGE